MTQHTPGPWCIQHVPHEDMIAVLQDGDDYESDDRSTCPNGGCDIAECFGPDRKANARLIAAAPDLLEALQNLLGDRVYEYQITQARAAIAKATGQA